MKFNQRVDLRVAERTIRLLADAGVFSSIENTSCPIDVHGHHTGVKLEPYWRDSAIHFLRCDGNLWITTGEYSGWKLLGKMTTELKDDIALVKSILIDPIYDYEFSPAIIELSYEKEMKEIRDCSTILMNKYHLQLQEGTRSCRLPGHTLWDSFHHSIDFAAQHSKVGPISIAFYQCRGSLCFDIVSPLAEATETNRSYAWGSANNAAKVIAQLIERINALQNNSNH